MKKSVPFLLTMLFLLSLCVKAQPPVDAGNAEVNYQLGIKLLQEGRPAEALPYLLAAVKINQESYLYRLNAGRAAQFSENYQPCVDNLTEAMRLRPKEQTAQAFYLWRAECHMELGNRQAAQSDYTEAVKLQPGMKWAYSFRIFYDTRSVCQGSAAGKYREAEAFYTANKTYEAYRELYIALKCDPKHLPSLKLRLKIESADNNLSIHAKIHRAQLEKIESANSPAANGSTPGKGGDRISEGFLARALDGQTPAPAGQNVKPASSPLLNKYLAQIEQSYAGLPVFTRTVTVTSDAKLNSELYGAVRSGKTQLALDLIKQGGDVNYQSATGFGHWKSVLTEAIEQQNLRLVKALLEAGANPNGNLKLKLEPPLTYAISKNNTLIVALLIKYKVDVNGLYNLDPTTFLMAAASPGSEDISALLIEAGANESVRNSKGETARQITERLKQAEAAKVPPTASELRAHRINMIVNGRKGIDRLVERFNAHMELLKKISSVMLHSEKIKHLYAGIRYLDDIINNATEIEKTAARLFSDAALDPQIRPSLQSKVSDVVKAKEDAIKRKKVLEQGLAKP